MAVILNWGKVGWCPSSTMYLHLYKLQILLSSAAAKSALVGGEEELGMKEREGESAHTANWQLHQIILALRGFRRA